MAHRLWSGISDSTAKIAKLNQESKQGAICNKTPFHLFTFLLWSWMKSLTRLIIKGNRLRCATKRVNDSPKAKTAATCKYSNSMWNTKWCTKQFLNELDSRSNVKETRLFHEKTSIVICSFLLFSHYSSSLPISFEIEIISSVWNFTSFLLSEFAAINHSIALTKWVCAMWSSSEQLQQWNNSNRSSRTEIAST